MFKKDIYAKLNEVLDPELGISIVDLGLIYNVEINRKNVKIIMTLTTIGCPLFGLISGQVREKIKELKGVCDVEIELTFDPPWNIDKMSKEGKIQLGFA